MRRVLVKNEDAEIAERRVEWCVEKRSAAQSHSSLLTLLLHQSLVWAVQAFRGCKRWAWA
jgi:hypothetical protein